MRNKMEFRRVVGGGGLTRLEGPMSVGRVTEKFERFLTWVNVGLGGGAMGVQPSSFKLYFSEDVDSVVRSDFEPERLPQDEDVERIGPFIE